MRARGFTLLEAIISASILSFVMVTALSLASFATKTTSEGAVKQLSQLQAQRVLDLIASDFRQCAAWQLFQVHNATNAPGSGTGDTAARLTQFWASNALTRGASSSTAAFTFPSVGTFDASTDAVAFLRVVGASVPTGQYLVFDYEPKEPAGTVFADVGANGGGAVADNQPGRMDDDPHRMFVLYRTRAVRNRIAVERVRGIAGIADGGATGLQSAPQWVVQVGDLGPVAASLPAGVAQGSVNVSGIDTAGAFTSGVSGAGCVRIKVRAVGRVDAANVVVSEIESAVAVTCAQPPQ